jgi:hypothetical protein
VTVVAEAEQDQIQLRHDRVGYFFYCLFVCLSRSGRIRVFAVYPVDVVFRDGHVREHGLVSHAIVAVWMIRRNVTFV